MSEKCIVYGCTNMNNQGSFIGTMCSPCYEMITKGEPKFHSDNFIHKLYLKKKKYLNVIYALKTGEKEK
jgi:hypothetical protein